MKKTVVAAEPIEITSASASDGAAPKKPLPFVVEDPLPLLKMREYTPTSFVIYGSQTRTYKGNLKKYGAHYNARLRVGPAWLIRVDNVEGVAKVKELVDRVNSGEPVAALVLSYQVIHASLVYTVPKLSSIVRFEDGVERKVKSVISDGKYPIYIILDDDSRYVRGMTGWIRDTSMEVHGRLYVSQSE